MTTSALGLKSSVMLLTYCHFENPFCTMLRPLLLQVQDYVAKQAWRLVLVSCQLGHEVEGKVQYIEQALG